MMKNHLLSIFFVLMGCLLKLPACTGILLRNTDGTAVHGRTLEFGTAIDTSIAIIPRGVAFTGQTPKGPGKKYTSKYAAIGIMAYDNQVLLDGVNEAGLSVGAFYFPTFAKYASPSKENQEKGLSPCDFPNWILNQFANIESLQKALRKQKVAILPTVVKHWGQQAPPFHYIVYDKSGESIVIEPIEGKLIIAQNPIGTITNSPTFDWHMTHLRNFIALNPRNVPPVTIDGETLKPLGQGSGMIGLPGDFTPPSRFVRATVFSATSLKEPTAEKGVMRTFHILNNFDIPIGVVREDENGTQHTDYTMLTVARDPYNLCYYYKTYEDQTIRFVDLSKFDLNAKTIKTLSTKSKQTAIDMTDKLKIINPLHTTH